MRYIVKVTPRALRQLAAIASWWRENRPEAPELAKVEILGVLASLHDHPDRGIQLAAGHERRRMLATPRTRFLVIYRVRPRARRVEIVELRRP